ncbi:Nitronate monooxygenase-domain-containing protein [Mycena maculata]|uniref:Nitronate monooxygenase-domain-containing protein n=1 Tax=Mycena maculata TaxID=230809 RepID=A0AAD7KA08_9AGAR|nr:Nitronate monooxygenase-domain-containing protein [Mycena maculata]
MMKEAIRQEAYRFKFGPTLCAPFIQPSLTKPTKLHRRFFAHIVLFTRLHSIFTRPPVSDSKSIMIPIKTPLSQRLGLKTPIIAAPMAFASTPELAAAVTAAGGLGCIGAGFDSTAELKTKIQKIRTDLMIAPGAPVPLAIGFIGWILDITEPSDDPRLLAFLDELPTAIWFAFGSDLGKYIAQVHAHDQKHGRKTFIFVIVGSVESALRYAPEVDCLVVQGIEAGGHGSSESPPLLSLLQAVLLAVPSGPLIVAAGGISTGAQIASLLTMGADGVVLGTRFLFTPECCYTPDKKEVILKAGFNSTVRTLAFDEVGRTNGWPAKHDGRAISNKIMDDFAAGLSLEERIAKFDDSAAKGENSRLIIWAGVGVGMTSEIKPASDVLRELHDEAVKKLQAGASLLSDSI